LAMPSARSHRFTCFFSTVIPLSSDDPRQRLQLIAVPTLAAFTHRPIRLDSHQQQRLQHLTALRTPLFFLSPIHLDPPFSSDASS
jgi:hypothetical protein